MIRRDTHKGVDFTIIKDRAEITDWANFVCGLLAEFLRRSGCPTLVNVTNVTDLHTVAGGEVLSQRKSSAHTHHTDNKTFSARVCCTCTGGTTGGREDQRIGFSDDYYRQTKR